MYLGYNLNIKNQLIEIASILNENQGALTLSIFIFTLLLGWISGAFRALRRKPDLKVETLPGAYICVRLWDRK